MTFYRHSIDVDIYAGFTGVELTASSRTGACLSYRQGRCTVGSIRDANCGPRAPLAALIPLLPQTRDSADPKQETHLTPNKRLTRPQTRDSPDPKQEFPVQRTNTTSIDRFQDEPFERQMNRTEPQEPVSQNIQSFLRTTLNHISYKIIFINFSQRCY